MVETLRAVHKFAVVVLDDPASNHKNQIDIQMGRKIVHTSLLQTAVICILKIKNKFIKLKEIIT
jgi:hypothetical protein